MNTAQLTKAAMGAAIAFAVYKFVDNTLVKSAAIGVIGTIVAKQLPIVRDAVNA